jgi:hypothetical protein
MPSLQILKAQNCSLDNLTEILSYPLLKQADLSYNSFESATNLNHSSLNNLLLGNGKLRGKFSGNNLTELLYLSLGSNIYLQGFEGNRLPKLK